MSRAYVGLPEGWDTRESLGDLVVRRDGLMLATVSTSGRVMFSGQYPTLSHDELSALCALSRDMAPVAIGRAS